MPTISLDHCFMGSEDSGEDGVPTPALENPCLIMYDADSEAIYCLPVASKAVSEYIVHCVKAVIDELGYGDVRIALKHDAAPELIALRQQVRELRTAPTTPIDVPVQESKMNGAVERAVRSWEGQFRTIRDHLESELSAIDERQIIATHPLWQWCAWWASSIMNRYVVRPNGRTTYELITGHKKNC